MIEQKYLRYLLTDPHVVNDLQECSLSSRFIDKKKMGSCVIWMEAVMLKEIHSVVEGGVVVHIRFATVHCDYVIKF